MTSKQTASPTSKMMAYRLGQLRQKMATLQQEQNKIRQTLGQGLLQCLIDAEAFEGDFDALVGGILEVVTEIKNDDGKVGPERSSERSQRVEAWKKSGLMFQQHRNQKERERGSQPQIRNRKPETRGEESSPKSA